jgi:hypothetical protein
MSEIGGQTMVLLVTLFVTPVAYSLFDEVAIRWRRSVQLSGDPLPTE